MEGLLMREKKTKGIIRRMLAVLLLAVLIFQDTSPLFGTAIRALAEGQPGEDYPDLVSAMQDLRGEGGGPSMTEERTITLSRRQTATATLQLSANESSSFQDVIVHVDAPYIYKDNEDRIGFAYTEEEARNKGTLIGGVEVFFDTTKEGIGAYDPAAGDPFQILNEKPEEESAEETSSEQESGSQETTEAEPEEGTTEGSGEETTAETVTEQSTEGETSETGTTEDTQRSRVSSFGVLSEEESQDTSTTEAAVEETSQETTTINIEETESESVTETETETKQETETETKEETETETETSYPEAAIPNILAASTDSGNLYDPLLYPPYPNEIQMAPGSTGEGWWRGRTAVRITNEITNSSRPNISVQYRFWVEKGQNIPEGTKVTLYSWAQYDRYMLTGDTIWFDKANNPYRPDSPFIERDPYRVEGQGNLVYTNIDWQLAVKTVKGAENAPVLSWQKNNYASFLMSVTNTSGMIENEKGELVLPSNPEDYVPDSTTFDDFTLLGNAGEYTGGSQFKRYFYEDGKAVKNEEYTSADSPANQLYTGVWMDNLLESVGYDVSQYDESGGILILDVSALSEAERNVENADTLLADPRVKRIGYTISAGSEFAVNVSETLYPPHMKQGNTKPDGSGVYDRDYVNSKVYRVFVPYNTNLKLDQLHTEMAVDGTIYFGPKEEESGRGEYPWRISKNDGVYFKVPEIKVNGEKKVLSEKADVGQELIYTLEGVEFTNGEGTKTDLPPMYRPTITDVLPAEFDFTGLRITVPLEHDREGIVDAWFGGEDKLLGIGVKKDSADQPQTYTILQYLSSDGAWVDVANPAYTRTEEDGNAVYTLDYSRFFEKERDYLKEHTIRINYKTAMSAQDDCPCNVQIAGKSRVAGIRTNQATVTYIRLNYNMELQSDAVREGLLTDIVGYFPVDKETHDMYHVSNDSTADADFNKSDIKGNLQVHTIIKEKEKWDEDELKTPLGLEAGRYVFSARNDADGQGYNTSFSIDLPVKVTNTATEETDQTGFLTKGIYINQYLIYAGEPQWKRDEKGAILYGTDGAPLEEGLLRLTGVNGAEKLFTSKELLAMVGKHTSDEPLHENCAYIDFTETTQLYKDLGGQVQKVELLYSAFYGQAELLKANEADPDANPDQANQYMEIVGTCFVESECKADLSWEIKGWTDRFENQLVDTSVNRYTGKDDGTLIFEMANPTVDAYVNWIREDQKAKLQTVPFQDRFSYDISLGNDSTALMSKGEITFQLDVNPADADLLPGTGFIAESLSMDVSHMMETDPDKNWAELTKIEFYEAGAALPDNEQTDPNGTADPGDPPLLTLTWAELQSFISGTTLIIPKTAWEGTDEQPRRLGAIRLYLSDMDSEMRAEHQEEDPDNPGQMITVPEKLFHLRIFGMANAYERDLALGNRFVAISPQLPDGTVLTKVSEDVGELIDPDDPEKGGYGIKKLYLDANPEIKMTVSALRGLEGNETNYSNETYKKRYPTGGGVSKSVRRNNVYSGDLITLDANLSNIYNGQEMSDMIRAVVQFTVPGRINPDIYNRSEGFLVKEVRFSHVDENDPITGGIDEVIVTGLDRSGNACQVTLSREEIYGKNGTQAVSYIENGERVIASSAWNSLPDSAVGDDGVAVVTDIKIIYAKFDGKVSDTEKFQVKLVGTPSFGGPYRIKTDFYTEGTREDDKVANNKTGKFIYTVHNNGNTAASGSGAGNAMPAFRPVKAHFAQDHDERVLMVQDSSSLFHESDAYYRADQTVEGEERTTMGNDWHAGRIYVPHNTYEKQYHFYVGSYHSTYGLCDSVLHVELPVKRVDTAGEDGTVTRESKGFLFRELNLPKEELEKMDEIFEIQFIGADAAGEGLDYDDTSTSTGVLTLRQYFSDVREMAPDDINQFMDDAGNLVITWQDVQDTMQAMGLGEIGDIRYIRVRFTNVKNNTYTKDRAVKVTVKGITNTYTEANTAAGLANSALDAKSQYYRTEYFNFETNKPESALPANSGNLSHAYIEVMRPHPYAFVQAIFEDQALADKGIKPGEGTQSSAANTISPNTQASVPAGNLTDLEEYDRYLHSYKVTFGNRQNNNSSAGTSGKSYSDLIHPVFNVDLPQPSEKRGFQTTAVTLDPNLLLYGRGCRITLYSSEYDGTKTEEENKGNWFRLEEDALQAILADDGRVDLSDYPEMKDWYVKTVRVEYDIFYGNDHNTDHRENNTSTNGDRETNKQTYIILEGMLTSYADDSATSPNHISYGNLITAAASGTVPEGYDHFAPAAKESDTRTGSFKPYKPLPGMDVKAANNTGSLSGDKGTASVSMGAETYYRVHVTNAGKSRQYYSYLQNRLPVSKSPKTDDRQTIGGFQLTKVISDYMFISNITRDGKIHLESIYLREFQPLPLDADGKVDESLPLPGKKEVLIRRVKDENGSPVYQPGSSIADYEIIYIEDGQESTPVSIEADKLFGTDPSGRTILMLQAGVWNTEQFQIDYPEYCNLEIGQFNSAKENGTSTSGYLNLYGTPDSYYYDENYNMSRKLRLDSTWTEHYEVKNEATLEMYTRSAESYAYLEMNPSDPTLSMTAVKANTPSELYDGSGKRLPVSYENKTGTYYSLKLGNQSDSAMSRPVLGIDLPLYDDNPATLEQEERRRGFQLTGLYLDRNLIGDGISIVGWRDADGIRHELTEPKPDDTTGITDILDEGIAEILEITVYDRVLKKEDGTAVSYTIKGDELAALLEQRKTNNGIVTIPYSSWYAPESDPEKAVLYPGRVEITFDRFDNDVRAAEDLGEVRLYGNLNRYGDERTYQSDNTANNVVNPGNIYTNPGHSGTTPVNTSVQMYGNEIMAKASFLDYVAGTTQKITPVDYTEAWDYASFQVREPRPMVNATTVYYNRDKLGTVGNLSNSRSAYRNDGSAIYSSEDGNTNWNIVPYGREYLSVFDLSNDSVSRMENFKFTMTPDLSAANAADPNRGFHTLDIILRRGLFEKAVIDKIVITDKDNPARQIIVTRVGEGTAPGETPFRPGDSASIYGIPVPGTVNRTAPKEINAGSHFVLTYPDGTEKEIGFAQGGESSYSVAEGVYEIQAGDLFISRAEIVGAAGMKNVGKVEIYGSDFLPQRTSVNSQNKPARDSQAVVFVGISDKEPTGNTSTNSTITDTATTQTTNRGEFQTYLYGHTEEQVIAGTPVTGEQDGVNNFAEAASAQHRRQDTDVTYIKTPKLAFDTTISAVFKDGTESRRFTDETISDAVVRRGNWNNWPHNPPNEGYKDNNVLTIGNKSLAGFTVDFRQLWYAMQRGSGSSTSNGTILQDYNAAATVQMTIDLPKDNFDAYYLKLRPALKPFVTKITIQTTTGETYSVPVTDWTGNARGTTENNYSYTISADARGNNQWWRINLLDLANSGSWYVTKTIGGYDPFDLDDTANADHPYYRSPAMPVQAGQIQSVTVTMNINEDPANPNSANLYEVISADEGIWYRESNDRPDTVPGWTGAYGNSSSVHEESWNTTNQSARHAIEIAGRVMNPSASEKIISATVNTRLELGTQFRTDEVKSVGAGAVENYNQVSRLRVQDGKTLGRNYSSWSYRDYYRRTESSWSSRYGWSNYEYFEVWHAGHLQDKAEIKILPPVVELNKGLGQTADDKAFSAPSGDITYDMARQLSHGVPVYGGLRGYALGINQRKVSAIEKSTVLYSTTYNTYYDYLYTEWSTRFTHVDSVTFTDTLPEISRPDGWYKGFFSRYVQIADSIKDNLAYVDITIAEHNIDAVTGEVLTTSKAARTVRVKREDLYGTGKGYDGKVLFRYEPNKTGNIDGLTSDGELDGDRLEEAIRDAEGNNIVTLKKNEYPSQIQFTVWNLPGNGDQTDEYTGVRTSSSQSGNRNPDAYIFGNVCEILDDVYPSSNPRSTIWTKTYHEDHTDPDDYYNTYYRYKEIMDDSQIKPRVNNSSAAYCFFTSAEREENSPDNGWKLTTSGESNATYISGWYDGRRSLLYASGVRPGVRITIQTYDETPDHGTKEKPSPVSNFYDYGPDNKTPNRIAYRIWATNTTTQTIPVETNAVYPMDTTGTYYKEIDYSSTAPNGLRTQKIWIPVEFINEKYSPGQGAETEDVKTLGSNKFVVDRLVLKTATQANQRNTNVTSMPSPSSVNAFDLKAYVLDEMIQTGGLPVGEKAAYVSYADADREPVTEPDQARYYCIDLEKMFLDQVSYTDAGGTVHTLSPVKTDSTGTKAFDPNAEDLSYYLQMNTLAFDYRLKVRTGWLTNFVKNRQRYFGPNKNGTATLTGENGAVPADLIFEGIFVDRYYKANEPVNSGNTVEGSESYKEWDLESKPTVNTNSLELNKVVRDWVSATAYTAGINSWEDADTRAEWYRMEQYTGYENWKDLRFRNRAAKINIAVNRLPYHNTLGTDGTMDLTPDPKNGGSANTPAALSYGNRNDFNASDSNTARDKEACGYHPASAG